MMTPALVAVDAMPARALTLAMSAGSAAGPAAQLMLLVAAAVTLGATACWTQRRLLATRGQVLHWILASGLAAAAATCLLMLASTGGSHAALLGEPLNSPGAWAKLGLQVYAMSLSMFGLLALAITFVDRLVHRSSSDALAAAKHVAKMALPTAALAMVLGFVLPAMLGVSATAGAGSWVIGGMLWVAIQAILCINVAAVGGAMALRSQPNQDEPNTQGKLNDTADATGPPATRDDRMALWLLIGGIVTLMMAAVGFVLLSFLMITLDTAGRGMMSLLALSEVDKPSLGAMAIRWLWLDALVVFAMAGGAAVVMRTGHAMGAGLGLSLSAMRKQGGKLSWFKAATLRDEKTFDAKAWSGAFDAATADISAAPVANPVTNPAQQTPEQASQTPAAAPSLQLNTPPVQIGSTQAGQHQRSKLPPLPAAAGVATSSTPSTPAVAASISSTSADVTHAMGVSWASLKGVFPTRIHYALMAILAGGFVFYASLVPVIYQPLAWNAAVQRFMNIKHYQLGIDRRADLLANLVVIVPVTYLMMAAVTGLAWGWLRRGAAAILVAAAAAVYVVAIEFTQEWFPPRTVSLNDIEAGLAGVVAGIILWLAIGDYLTYVLKIVVSKRGSASAIRQVLWLILGSIVVYSMFPMDFTLSMKSLSEKYHEGRMVLIPFLQGNDRALKTLGVFLRDMVLFVPVGVLASRPWLTREPLSWRQSMLLIVAVAIVLEIIHLPVFSSFNGSIHVLGRIAGGAAGLALVPHVLDAQGQLTLGSTWPAGRRRQLGTAIGLVLALVAAGALLYPFNFDGGMAMFKAKMGYFLNWPFQLYYYSGEWSALSKVVQCMALFLPTGLAMRWAWNSNSRRRTQGLVATLVLVGAVGLGVELAQAASGQRQVHKMSLDQGISMGTQEQAMDITDIHVSKGMVFSVGKLADVTDWLAYLAGTLSGWTAAGLMLPVERREED